MSVVLDFLQRALLQRAGFTPREMDLDGCRVQYWEREARRRARNRPPLVLLHGLGSHSVVWWRVGSGLWGAGAVWALDLPGHGGSRRLPGTPPMTPRRLAGLVARFLEAKAGGRPAVVAGHSLGGWVAGWLAADAPERVGASVLLAPAGADTQKFRELHLFFRELQKPEDIPKLWRRIFPRVPWWTRLLGEGAWRTLQTADARTLIEDTPEDELLRKTPGSRSSPVWLAWGAEDGLMGPDSRAYFRGLFPQAAEVCWEGAGHVLPVERPGDVTSLLLQALQGAEGSTSPRPPAPGP